MTTVTATPISAGAPIGKSVMIAGISVPGRFTRWGFIATITPELAEKLLGQNHKNRKLRETRVHLYARDIHRWHLNGATLVFDSDGVLLDGQHRLSACVEAGVAFETYIIGDIGPDNRDSIDSGFMRNLSDVLGFKGEGDVMSLSSGLVVAWRIENNGHLFSGAGLPWPTREDLTAYLEANPGIRDSLSPGRAVARAIHYPKSVAVGLHYLMSSIDDESTREFFDRLADGVGLYPSNPVFALRAVLLKNVGSVRRLQPIDIAAMTIKAWVAFRERRPVMHLRWRRGGKAPEAFPSLTS